MHPGRGAALVSVCTARSRGTRAPDAEQHGDHAEEARVGREACWLAQVLRLPAPFPPTDTLEGTTWVSGLWSHSDCVHIWALPLVHHDLVQFLCALIYPSGKEGWVHGGCPHGRPGTTGSSVHPGGDISIAVEGPGTLPSFRAPALPPCPPPPAPVSASMVLHRNEGLGLPGELLRVAAARRS